MIPRYRTPEMEAVWSTARKYEIWREVELTVCEVRAARGEIPAADVRRLRERAGSDPARIEAIEATVQHDVIAFLTDLAEHVGPEARHVHQGMTSSDLLDTALALQLREAGGILLAELDRLLAAVERRAREHERTVMAGRSHGIHAEPTTFGLKLLVYWSALRRGRRRLAAAVEEISYGKISGAVGTLAHLEPAIEEESCRRLGLRTAGASTQVLQRDRHAAFLAAVAILGATIEQIALEVRNLQRTDVHEVEEPFGRGQKGSSAMPHKRNPIVSERLCGLARLLRGHAHAAMENVALWHERDISHSSVERIILPDSCHLLHYMLGKARWLVEGLVVFPERMRQNLERVRGLVFSQAVLLALTEAGSSREDAYLWVQRASMRVWDEGIDFARALAEDPDVPARLGRERLARCFDLEHQLRNVGAIFARTLGEADPGDDHPSRGGAAAGRAGR